MSQIPPPTGPLNLPRTLSAGAGAAGGLTGSAAQTAGKRRAITLDALQWAAMFDIIDLHLAAQQPRILLGFGLPLFLISTVIFTARQSQPRPLGEVVSRRFARLIQPWLFWSAVYALPLLYFAWRGDETIFSKFEPEMIFFGTRIHLWFLPFAFFAGLTGYLAHRWLIRRSARWVTVVLGLATAGCFALDRFTAQSEQPWMQWGFAAASIPIALGVSQLVARQALGRRPEWEVLAGLVLTLLGAVMVAVLREPWTPGLYAICGGLVIAALAQPMRPAPALWAKLQGMLFGVYLTHLLIALVWQMLASQSTQELPQGLRVACIMGLSLLATWFLQHTPLRRFV